MSFLDLLDRGLGNPSPQFLSKTVLKLTSETFGEFRRGRATNYWFGEALYAYPAGVAGVVGGTIRALRLGEHCRRRAHHLPGYLQRAYGLAWTSVPTDGAPEARIGFSLVWNSGNVDELVALFMRTPWEELLGERMLLNPEVATDRIAADLDLISDGRLIELSPEIRTV